MERDRFERRATLRNNARREPRDRHRRLRSREATRRDETRRDETRRDETRRDETRRDATTSSAVSNTCSTSDVPSRIPMTDFNGTTRRQFCKPTTTHRDSTTRFEYLNNRTFSSDVDRPRCSSRPRFRRSLAEKRSRGRSTGSAVSTTDARGKIEGGQYPAERDASLPRERELNGTKAGSNLRDPRGAQLLLAEFYFIDAQPWQQPAFGATWSRY